MKIMSKLTNHQMIRKVMKRKKNWKSYEIQSQLAAQYEKFMSESTLTRRLREMADVIAIRPKSKTIKAWDYQLIR